MRTPGTFPASPSRLATSVSWLHLKLPAPLAHPSPALLLCTLTLSVLKQGCPHRMKKTEVLAEDSLLRGPDKQLGFRPSARLSGSRHLPRPTVPQAAPASQSPTGSTLSSSPGLDGARTYPTRWPLRKVLSDQARARACADCSGARPRRKARGFVGQ